MNIESGIYCIRNIVDNKRYVGSAKCLKIRKSKHFNSLKRNNHFNNYLQNAWNKYNEENFVFEILEIIQDLNILLEREDFYILFYKSNNPEFGYNIRKNATNNLGIKYSEESKKKMSESMKGIPKTEEAKKNLSEAKKGIPLSEEHRIKLINSRKGRKHTPETLEKMRLANLGEKNPMYGKSPSEETRKKMSDAGKGKVFTEEHKKHLSENHDDRRGQKHTEESKQKMRDAKKGRGIGQENAMAKLTENDVIEIKKMIRDGIKIKDIAEKFNVTVANISCIKLNKSWKHVNLDDEENKNES